MGRQQINGVFNQTAFSHFYIQYHKTYFIVDVTLHAGMNVNITVHIQLLPVSEKNVFMKAIFGVGSAGAIQLYSGRRYKQIVTPRSASVVQVSMAIIRL